MCGIAGALHLAGQVIADLDDSLEVMNQLQEHRGPDGAGTWSHPSGHVGFAHRRLSIIDLEAGAQPMTDHDGNWLVFNGEIYNYLELRERLGAHRFRTRSDTETILQAYREWGPECVQHLRGMFAFALWDQREQRLFCARDRFGIKPFHYLQRGEVVYFASEAKALLPFVERIATNREGLKEYLYFQFCLDGKTLFKDIHELLPGHTLTCERGRMQRRRYWQVYYHIDFDHSPQYFTERLNECIKQSVDLHRRSDVPIGAYLSGGLDSSIVAAVAARDSGADFAGFNGKFAIGPKYDESRYARLVAEQHGFACHEIDIGVRDFIDNIRRVIYHLDYPVAGPGSFPQYMVSMLASKHRKVVLGGQGGDEIFGGYARYLIAYFEQCIKAAINGTMHNGNFVVTYESIIPNLVTLREYQPLLQEFWRDELFADLDRRYFRLINRAPSLGDEVRWDLLEGHDIYEAFLPIFRAQNVGKESYFDLMTHFDFKTLLPALLQVEDRVSMAHGLESRVPFLDHPLVEFAATIPANVKMKDGHMKHVLRHAAQPFVPREVIERKDKMGFPVPLAEWLRGEANAFVRDVFTCRAARQRDVIDNARVAAGLDQESHFGRKIWGFLSLELWQQEFHDREGYYKSLLREPWQAPRSARLASKRTVLV
jgi:asparagine synthase (glutamine-hydrolysing)